MHDSATVAPPYQLTFHIPLHRHLTGLIVCCLRHDFLPSILTQSNDETELFYRRLVVPVLKIQVILHNSFFL